MKERKPENIVDLQDDMLEIWQRYKKNEIGTAELKSAAIMSGKLMTASKLEMEHNKLIQSGRKVKFLICRDDQKG